MRQNKYEIHILLLLVASQPQMCLPAETICVYFSLRWTYCCTSSVSMALRMFLHLITGLSRSLLPRGFFFHAVFIISCVRRSLHMSQPSQTLTFICFIIPWPLFQLIIGPDVKSSRIYGCDAVFCFVIALLYSYVYNFIFDLLNSTYNYST